MPKRDDAIKSQIKPTGEMIKLNLLKTAQIFGPMTIGEFRKDFIMIQTINDDSAR